MDRKIVEKFFINQTTPEETRRVLDWFETAEGKQYLQERLDIDSDLMDRRELRKMVPDLDSDHLFEAIQEKISQEKTVRIIRKPDWFGHAFKAAAAILVIFLTSVFYITNYTDPAETVAKREPIHFQTSNEENREIKLSDGSVVRLNKNSEITISEDFMQGSREIELTGEAYFDVTHNPDQPFIIHTNESSVRVLGTAFNVRALPGQDNVQVAVVDGRVAFTNADLKRTSPDPNDNSVILMKGQYAYMDVNENTFQVDDIAVENYLAWKSGRFEFEDLTLQQVCTQLNRLYEIECSYSNEQIPNLLITASFSNESLEKTLEVIALSLDIDYEHNQDRVLWRM